MSYEREETITGYAPARGKSQGQRDREYFERWKENSAWKYLPSQLKEQFNVLSEDVVISNWEAGEEFDVIICFLLGIVADMKIKGHPVPQDLEDICKLPREFYELAKGKHKKEINHG